MSLDFINGVGAWNAAGAGGAAGPPYWRLLAASGTGGAEWALREVEFLPADGAAFTGGAALSGGSHSSYPAANAFDGVLVSGSANIWASSQTGGAVNGVAWIGVNFGRRRDVRRARLNTYASTANAVTAALVQSSEDGVAWATVATISMPAPVGETWFETTW